jgi:thiol-disulfide isomerase/thioredoxin
MKQDPVKLAVAAAAFLVVMVAIAWKGIAALPEEIEREHKQICMPLEPDPGWQEKPAQEFKLKDYYGKSESISAFRGKVVFLNFWATWCPPCRDEMDSMIKLARQLKGKDFAMVLVSEDKSWQDILQFVPQDLPDNIHFYMDEDYRVAHAYGTQKLPETYLIDKQGNVRQYVINKREWASPLAQTCVESLME